MVALRGLLRALPPPPLRPGPGQLLLLLPRLRRGEEGTMTETGAARGPASRPRVAEREEEEEAAWRLGWR